LLALLLLTLALPGPTAAAEPPWGAPEQTAASSPAYSPRLAYDREGFLHLVFFSGPRDSEWEVFYTTNRSGAWASPRRLSDGGDGSQRNPDIAVGPDGRVHVAFERRFEGGRGQILYVESPDRGASWSAPQNLSNTPGRAFEPALAADANGTLHVAWIDSRWAGILQVTYAARAPGAAFNPPQRLGSRTEDFGPDIAVSGAGADVQAHIVYSGRPATSESTGDQDIFYAVVGAGGIAAPVNLTNDPGVWSLTPSITSDGASKLFLAWDTESGNHDIVFARSSDRGRTWTPPQNVAPRGTQALNPTLAYGLLDGRPRVHLLWTEGVTGGTGALYLGFDPAANAFVTGTELAGPPPVGEAAIAGSPTTNQAALAYRGGSARVFASLKGVSNIVSAALSFDDMNGFTRRSTLLVTLADISGEPAEMRYALDRQPGAGDPWVPLQTSFSVGVPPSVECTRTLYLQLRNRVGRVSPVLSRSVVVDGAVQARVDLRGVGGSYGAHPDYTSVGQIQLSVVPDGECVGLRYVFVDSPAPFLVPDERFEALLPLSIEGSAAEGTRQVSLRVQDDLGNELALRRTLTVDRTPPTLVSGTLRIDAPPTGLPTPGVTLRIDGLVARDNFFPGAVWALLLANTSDASLPDEQLRWRSAELTGEVAAWSLITGLEDEARDGALAGAQLEVRARLLDGAGNPSAETLTTTVRLADDFRAPLELFVPFVAGG
jgi:hypothetical protein